MIEDGGELEKVMLNKCINDINAGSFASVEAYNKIAWGGALPKRIVDILEVSVTICIECNFIYEDGCCEYYRKISNVSW